MGKGKGGKKGKGYGNSGGKGGNQWGGGKYGYGKGGKGRGVKGKEGNLKGGKTGDGKGKGKPQFGGCWECGGEHYAANCPYINRQTGYSLGEWYPPGVGGGQLGQAVRQHVRRARGDDSRGPVDRRVAHADLQGRPPKARQRPEWMQRLRMP